MPIFHVFMTIALLTLFISAWKLSSLQHVWEKIGRLQPIVAPLISLVIMVLNALGREPLTFYSVFHALFVGLGSIAFHELLDGLKVFPKIAPVSEKISSFASQVLGGRR